MPKLDGLDFLSELKKEDIQVPVVMITGHGTIDTAVEAIKRGAYDFIQKPLDLNSNIIPDENNNLYIKKHFSPLFEKLLLVILSYIKLPNKLQSDIKYIINLIDNDTNVNNILKKIKEINNDILTLLNNKQIISDKVAKTYLLMAKTTLDVIIKNCKLLILQEPNDFKSDILKLNKDMETIMSTHLEKILKLIISLEYNSSDDSNIKTYLLVDFNSAIENVIINNDSSNTQISNMLTQLAKKLETSNNECNCENKVKEAVEKYLKNGKYIDDNGIIKNIINSDMIYNQLDISMLQSLGSYDNSFSNKWDKGYTYLDTSKWSVPKVQIPPPPNINNILSSLTPGYPINVLEFDTSRKVLGPDNINLQYIKEKLN
jgi:CheY-like chemotaxis protein